MERLALRSFPTVNEWTRGSYEGLSSTRHPDHMIKSTPTQWITKRRVFLRCRPMMTSQAVDCLDVVFALSATMKRSRVLDEGSRLQLGAGVSGVVWLKLKHDK